MEHLVPLAVHDILLVEEVDFLKIMQLQLEVELVGRVVVEDLHV